MVSRWCEIKRNIKTKIYSLRCIGAGFIYFIILYILTVTFKTSLCPIKKLFGISCLGCGLTRAFMSILAFDFKSAVEYNVLSLPLFFGIIAYISVIISDILLSKNNIKKVDRLLSRKYMFIVYLIILIFKYCVSHKTML